MERFVADVTFVCFIAAMRQFMIFVVPFLVESFPTKFTNEWFITSVNSGVCVKCG